MENHCASNFTILFKITSIRNCLGYATSSSLLDLLRFRLGRHLNRITTVVINRIGCSSFFNAFIFVPEFNPFRSPALSWSFAQILTQKQTTSASGMCFHLAHPSLPSSGMCYFLAHPPPPSTSMSYHLAYPYSILRLVRVTLMRLHHLKRL